MIPARNLRAAFAARVCGMRCGPSCACVLCSRLCNCAANYLEVADIDTVTTGSNTATANAFTDGLTMSDGTFLPLNQVRRAKVVVLSFSAALG